MAHRLVTGIHSQSDEVLALIFQNHIADCTEDIIHTSQGPWVLSRVCRPWRKISLAHPELWSVIRVEGPDSSDMFLYDSDSAEDDMDIDQRDSRPKLLFLLELALDRSQDHPLDVTLTLGPSETMEMKILYQQLMGAVVTHSHKWKTAYLQITNAAIPSFAAIQNHLQLLAELTLFCSTEFGQSARPFPYAQNAPCLTDLTLVEFPHQIVSVPWNSIRRFSETHIYPGALQRTGFSSNTTEMSLKLLRSNPLLESLDVNVASPSPMLSSSQSTLTHSLRRLVATDGNLIRSLTLPRLEELVVPAADTIPAIRDLLTRSKCALRSLRLIDFTLDKTLLSILSSSSSLRTLIIVLSEWDSGDEKTMKLLVKKLTEPSFLPCLEDLDIVLSLDRNVSFMDSDSDSNEPTGIPQKIAFINDTLVEMLGVRWERRGTSSLHLKKVFVWVEFPATVSLSKARGIGRLRKMCDEGLDVMIRVGNPLKSMQSYVYDHDV
ncbi:hypothetical protein C8R43DRAFT_972864 [Mycena crocata]|nr:hypothetical protein C8R43DRAFT_972864 [Mycena crocata]